MAAHKRKASQNPLDAQTPLEPHSGSPRLSIETHLIHRVNLFLRFRALFELFLRYLRFEKTLDSHSAGTRRKFTQNWKKRKITQSAFLQKCYNFPKNSSNPTRCWRCVVFQKIYLETTQNQLRAIVTSKIHSFWTQTGLKTHSVIFSIYT